MVETVRGHPHPVVAFPDADSFLPSWSRDGRWIYFTSNRGEKGYQIWKQAVQDGASALAPPVQVTRDGGFGAVETDDGETLLYTKGSSPGIWAMPPGGGGETSVWGGPGPDNFSNWAVTRSVFTSLPQRPASHPRLNTSSSRQLCYRKSEGSINPRWPDGYRGADWQGGRREADIVYCGRLCASGPIVKRRK